MLVCRNTIYYYTFLLYPAALLILFIGFNSLLRNSLGFSVYNMILSAIETVLLTPFQSDVFYFFL